MGKRGGSLLLMIMRLGSWLRGSRTSSGYEEGKYHDRKLCDEDICGNSHLRRLLLSRPRRILHRGMEGYVLVYNGLWSGKRVSDALYDGEVHVLR